ncbi:hypothetical protein C0033_16745 [Clostridium sp. chh4-2]|uniref:helix-turn-helix domain-containing protein n=1 Tax=Clostridium sp. chh4-2 TaxID=2067550 RepID=UPI000CCF5CDF|nr:helix-turn-helix domain-containing protein [Clostridium sp. chh4-2]PNV60840.1 hypothetical protein C0033_16745 [Clostridium sp. chh4-2]
MSGIKFDKLFFKFLLSYLLVLLIPVLLINGLFGYRFIQAYQKEIQAQVDVDLMHFGDTIDSEMQTLARTVDQMHLLMDFNGFHFTDNPLEGRRYVNNLSIYCTTNPFIREMALYLRNEDYMFIDQSTCKVELFLGQLYRFENTDPDRLMDQLVHGERRMVLPAQMVKTPGKDIEYITVLEPLYTDYQTIKGTCIFFIEADTIRNRIHNQLGKYGAVLCIRDRDGRLLFASDKEFEDQEGILENSQYFTSVHVSDQTGWTYVAYVPQDQHFLQKINAINRELLFITIFVLILAGVLISVLMRMNYSPIRRLGEKASSLLNNPKQKGELETISTTLDFLSDQNQYLSNKLQNSAAAIKSNRIHKLLTGHYMSREDFNLDVQDLNMKYENDWFFVAVVQIHGKIEEYDAFALRLQELLSGFMESFYTFTPEPDKIILINGLKKEESKRVEKALDQMRISVKEEYHLELTLGVGKIYSGTLSIPRSYLEARSALDYRFVKGNGNTILYKDLLVGDNAAFPYPKRQFEQLKEAISQSDQNMIHVSVSSLIDYIQKKNLPLFVAKGICFDILSLFIEISASFHYTLSDTVDLSGLMQLDTVDDVIRLIQQLNTELASQPVSQPKQDSDRLLEEIIVYIRENCLRCDFSIQETAEHFNMLLPNLSQFFKEKTGQNILDYSTDFRMEKAKKLLADHKLTLKDISQQVGYYNVSSFIRRFKQLNGITPGDYRKLRR